MATLIILLGNGLCRGTFVIIEEYQKALLKLKAKKNETDIIIVKLMF